MGYMSVSKLSFIHFLKFFVHIIADTYMLQLSWWYWELPFVDFCAFFKAKVPIFKSFMLS